MAVDDPKSDTVAAAQETDTQTDAQTQETSERLYAGRYKTVEELERGYKEAQGFATRLNEQVTRLSALSQMPSQTHVAPVEREEDADRFMTVAEFNRKATEFAERERQRFQGELTQQRQSEAAQQRFYTMHPDLQKHRKVVRAVAAELAEKYAGMPNWAQPTESDLMDEVANATRTELASMRKDWEAEQTRRAVQAREAQTAPAPGTGGTSSVPATKEPATEEEFRREALRERQEEFAKARRV